MVERHGRMKDGGRGRVQRWHNDIKQRIQNHKDNDLGDANALRGKIMGFRNDRKLWNRPHGPLFRTRAGAPEDPGGDGGGEEQKGGAPAGDYDFSKEVTRENYRPFMDAARRHQRDMDPDNERSAFNQLDVEPHRMHGAYIRALAHIQQEEELDPRRSEDWYERLAAEHLHPVHDLKAGLFKYVLDEYKNSEYALNSFIVIRTGMNGVEALVRKGARQKEMMAFLHQITHHPGGRLYICIKDKLKFVSNVNGESPRQLAAKLLPLIRRGVFPHNVFYRYKSAHGHFGGALHLTDAYTRGLIRHYSRN